MSKQSKDFSEKALRTERRMKIMLKYIAEHYANELRVEDIANSAMISESECLRCFHDSVCNSPINEIAEQCGFQDMSYFTKSFRELKVSDYDIYSFLCYILC